MKKIMPELMDSESTEWYMADDLCSEFKCIDIDCQNCAMQSPKSLNKWIEEIKKNDSD